MKIFFIISLFLGFHTYGFAIPKVHPLSEDIAKIKIPVAIKIPIATPIYNQEELPHSHNNTSCMPYVVPIATVVSLQQFNEDAAVVQPLHQQSHIINRDINRENHSSFLGYLRILFSSCTQIDDEDTMQDRYEDHFAEYIHDDESLNSHDSTPQ